MDKHKFIFIGGLHRSGTTILAKCLQEHPQVSGFENTGVPADEGQHLQTVFPIAKRYDGLRKPVFDELVDHISKRVDRKRRGGMGRFGYDPDAHMTENSPLITEENREKLFNEWKEYWDTEKPVLLEKSPENMIRMRFLQALFPDSYFILIWRHPISVSYSSWRSSKTTFHAMLGHWLHCYQLALEDVSHVRRFFTLKYEHFAEGPQLWINKLCQFLELPEFELKTGIRGNTNEKYFHKWRRFRKIPLAKSYVKYLEKKFENPLNRYGYSLERLAYVGEPTEQPQ